MYIYVCGAGQCRPQAKHCLPKDCLISSTYCASCDGTGLTNNRCRNEAATVLQKHRRRAVWRRSFLSLRGASVKVQSNHRRWCARRRLEQRRLSVGVIQVTDLRFPKKVCLINYRSTTENRWCFFSREVPTRSVSRLRPPVEKIAHSAMACIIS